MKSRMVGVALGAAMLAVVGQASVCAQTPQPFYKGKTMTLYVSGPPGSGYDLYARLFARRFSSHLPGAPTVIVSNVPGAAGIFCANQVYNIAAKDGTVLGLIRQSIAEEQVFQTDGVRYDVLKFNWIGRIAANVELTYVWHTVPVKTIDDVKTRETIIAAGGGSTETFPAVLNSIIGTRFKLVKGYYATPPADLAVERGEVEGSFGSVSTMLTTHRDWMENKLITILVQYALARHPVLPDVPAVVELAKTGEDRALVEFLANASAIGRSIVAPPDVPAERVAELRDAFLATMKDPEFLDDMRRTGADLSLATAEELRTVIANTVGVSAATRARAEAFR